MSNFNYSLGPFDFSQARPICFGDVVGNLNRWEKLAEIDGINAGGPEFPIYNSFGYWIACCSRFIQEDKGKGNTDINMEELTGLIEDRPYCRSMVVKHFLFK